MKAIDLSGHKFGRLTVIKFAHRKNSKRYWLCLCDCGQSKITTYNNLAYGQAKSCGCLKDQRADIAGKKFGRLTVLNFISVDKGRNSRWLCLCDCGNSKIICQAALSRGSTKSCGCLNREIAKERKLTHGKSSTKEYETWANMLGRCLNRTHPSYNNYGGRGIKVCEQWLKFENFYADMGDKPEGLSIDRINNDGNYELGNCRWATKSEQAYNRR